MRPFRKLTSKVFMNSFVIQLHRDDGNDDCAFCHKSMGPIDGPRLYLADQTGAVCRNCGKRRAPALVALLDLALAAQRVGQIGRHSRTLPLAALFDLAGAAENYSQSAAPQRRLAS
jgi:hypothetical protein